MPLSYLRGIFERCLAESNRSSRFCRPVPNRSAKAPFFVLGLQIYELFLNLQPLKQIYFLLIEYLDRKATQSVYHLD